MKFLLTVACTIAIACFPTGEKDIDDLNDFLHALSTACISLPMTAGITASHRQYRWACTEPEASGQWYIPSERDFDPGETVSTLGGLVTIYRVGNLAGNCYGEVTAIEFCYRYTVSGVGEPYFNWTVFILGDDGSGPFVIDNIYTIESSPAQLGNDNCYGPPPTGDVRSCCDLKQIKSFTLPVNFAFAITESAQGNTHGANLLGFSDSRIEYTVSDVMLLNKDTLNFASLAIGSTVPRTQSIQRSIRLLWFVTGKHNNIILLL